MKHPIIVVFETDETLMHTLESLAEQRHWLLRESRQGPACLAVLKSSAPACLIVKLGRNLARELTVVDQTHAALPNVPIVVVTGSEDPALTALILDLGASYVLHPPTPRQRLVEVVESLMNATIQRHWASAVEPEAPPREPNT